MPQVSILLLLSMTATCAAWFVLSVAAFYNTRLRISYALVTAGPLPLAISLSAVLLGAFVSPQLFVVALGALVAAVWMWAKPSSVQRHATPTAGSTSPAEAGSLVKVVAGNVLYTNDRFVEIAASVRVHEPDVVMMCEMTEESFAVMAPLLAPLVPLVTGATPHQVCGSVSEGCVQDVVLFVRPELGAIPTKGVRAGTRVFPSIILPLHGDLELCGVHTTSPNGRNDPKEWRSQLSAVAAVADAKSCPIVFAGDFNASWRHAPLRSSKLRTTFSFWRATWPHRFPVLELDHVLAVNASVLTVKRFVLPGSDHRGLVASVMVPPLPLGE